MQIFSSLKKYIYKYFTYNIGFYFSVNKLLKIKNTDEKEGTKKMAISLPSAQAQVEVQRLCRMAFLVLIVRNEAIFWGGPWELTSRIIWLRTEADWRLGIADTFVALGGLATRLKLPAYGWFVSWLCIFAFTKPTNRFPVGLSAIASVRYSEASV